MVYRLRPVIVTFVPLQHLIQRLPALVSAFFFFAAAVGFDLLLSFKPFVVTLYGSIGGSARDKA